jgi:hypothetical protein
MKNINWDEEAIAESMRRLGNAERVIEYFKEPLEEIITPLLKGGEVPALESMDVAQVLIFIHINLLGYLYSGSDSTINAVKFLREYLGKVDSRYQEVGGLLYHLLRHGLIHRFIHKRLKLSNGTILGFQYTLDMNRAGHLKMVGIQGAKNLSISLWLLYDDLLSAIDLFAEDIRNNQDLSDVFQSAFETRWELDEENCLRKKKYDKDLDFIYGLLGQGSC